MPAGGPLGVAVGGVAMAPSAGTQVGSAEHRAGEAEQFSSDRGADVRRVSELRGRSSIVEIVEIAVSSKIRPQDAPRSVRDDREGRKSLNRISAPASRSGSAELIARDTDASETDRKACRPRIDGSTGTHEAMRRPSSRARRRQPPRRSVDRCTLQPTHRRTNSEIISSCLATKSSSDGRADPARRRTGTTRAWPAAGAAASTRAGTGPAAPRASPRPRRP